MRHPYRPDVAWHLAGHSLSGAAGVLAAAEATVARWQPQERHQQ